MKLISYELFAKLNDGKKHMESINCQVYYNDAIYDAVKNPFGIICLFYFIDDYKMFLFEPNEVYQVGKNKYVFAEGY